MIYIEIEIWKDYDAKYMVSSLGRVLNKIKGTECKIYVDTVGYCRISINGKGMGLHRLVALTFLDNPENKPTVNHKNAIKGDNRLDNLEWATYKEQSRHISDNRLNKRSLYCCIVDENENIINVFKTTWQCSNYLNIKNFNVYASCFGDCNMAYNYKIRLYDEVLNIYIPTRFDREEVNIKGMYKKQIFCGINGKTYNKQQDCADDLKIRQVLVSEMLRGKKENKYKLEYIS